MKNATEEAQIQERCHRMTSGQNKELQIFRGNYNLKAK